MVLETGYRPRCPEQSPLYAAVAGHLEEFLARQRERDRDLPGFVETEFREFLECGVLAFGFVRVHCDGCGLDRVVLFSCKRRGFCNSCGGRRMADMAAHLVDRVFPPVPVRQWVLSLPHALRYRLAYDASLVTGVLKVFTKTVFDYMIQQARDFGATRRAQCGAVTFVQRFDSALRLNVHFHMVAIDGIYAGDENGHPQFQVLLSPGTQDIQRLVASLAERIPEFLHRRGLGEDEHPEECDPIARDEPGLAALYGASVSDQTTFGPNAGRRTSRIGDQIDPESMEAMASPRCARVDGYSLHANTAIHGGDRARLERLIQYCARPPVAVDRLEALLDGRFRYRLKRRWNDGSTHVVFHPLEFLEKLAALVPAPRAHLVRYSGVLAPAARWRPLIVAQIAAPITPALETSLSGSAALERNYSWAELMKRV